MYIELLAEVYGKRVELVGATMENIDGVYEYFAVVRTSEGFMLDVVHPSKLTILEQPHEDDSFALGLVGLLLNEGAHYRAEWVREQEARHNEDRLRLKRERDEDYSDYIDDERINQTGR